MTLDVAGIRCFSSFYLALKEINGKHDGIADDLLPNTNLTFALHDSKRSISGAFFGALHLATDAFNAQGVSAIVGAASSGPSASAAVVSAQLRIPQISYSATSPQLSDGKQYPYFMRTAPADGIEGVAVAEALRYHMGYTYVATVNAEDSCA